MADTLRVRAAVLIANEGVEQVELTDPLKALQAAGAEPELIAPQAGTVQAMNHFNKGERFPVDRTVDRANASDYIGLLLPGGVANPDARARIPRPSPLRRSSFGPASRWRQSATDHGRWSRPTC